VSVRERESASEREEEEVLFGHGLLILSIDWFFDSLI